MLFAKAKKEETGSQEDCQAPCPGITETEKFLTHNAKRKRVENMQTSKGRGRGFASMSPEKKREIASKGGKAAHAMGTAHKWTSEEAQAAGRKGGSISRRRPKSATQAQA